MPTSICCDTVASLTTTCLIPNGATSSTPKDLKYRCSNDFKSQNYALMACPHDSDRCGNQLYHF